MTGTQSNTRTTFETNGHAPTKAEPKARRAPPPLAIGLVVAALAFGVFVVLTPRAARSTPVLVLRHSVAAGDLLSPGDLRVVSLAVPRGMATVPAGDESSVVGQVAQSALGAGSLLVPSSYGSSYGPPNGTESVVGVSLKPGEYPPGLVPGDRVEVLVGPAQSGVPGVMVPLGTVVAPGALVTSVAASASDPNVVLVGLEVAPAEALGLAELGATGQAVVVAER